MAEINKKPVIVKINRGEITNSVTTVNPTQYNVDLFNGTAESFENYKLVWDANAKNYKYGTFTPLSAELNLYDYMIDNTLKLNGADVDARMGKSLIVGTHLPEQSVSDDLIKKQHIINCGEYNISAEFNFIYVQMTMGVSENFDEEKNRKTSENKYATAGELKNKCKQYNKKLGFSHYLTGYPTDGSKTPEEIGRDQAKKFLKAIIGNDKEVTNPEILNGGLRPMVVFVDNITQVGYYGSAPIGVKKEKENF